jgi:hypothetical protein
MLKIRISRTAIEKSSFLGFGRGVFRTKKSIKYCQGLLLLFKSGYTSDTDL